MYLQRETNPEQNTVTAYGAGYIKINHTTYTESIYFTPSGSIHPLKLKTVNEIKTKHLYQLTGVQVTEQSPLDFLNGENPHLKNPYDIEILLLGTGYKQVFLNPELTSDLQSIGIGVEIMSTPAAARTYNILMSEGRRVVTALII